eukprot:CAMPEP_0175085016 /NCGR_PEP_ID=MMETSP0052_2-20121109/28404_1 /TAXON_ID=51329 ORGANISM="Polytomella parva, Strain SAG 63-3" /NCGR_SAMPLE_ID=MMETSP0052_2 /ASSEMBLY_ACC=CAM_ASM_000194 /LENGTH=54 /DNA_ID=CAMNT_0016356931 /DNA_START=291 /DNA_END=452 /DNA_ORIENTATION=+
MTRTASYSANPYFLDETPYAVRGGGIVVRPHIKIMRGQPLQELGGSGIIALGTW